MRIKEDGFTIIELLIATAIFTVILILVTTAIIGISNTYVKGAVEGQTQQSSRTVLSDISQDIEFNTISSILPSPSLDVNNQTTLINQATNKNIFYFCIGNDVYVYKLDLYLSSQTGSEYSPWALIRYSSSSCPTAGNVPTSLGAFPKGYEELLSTNERLGQLNIEQSLINNIYAYTIDIEVAYGHNDLLSDTKYNNAYVNEASSPPVGYQYQYACQSGIDSSFCAISTLTTTITPRIND